MTPESLLMLQRAFAMLLISGLCALSGASAIAAPEESTPPKPAPLIVGTSGDYAPFSVGDAMNDGTFSPDGFGPALIRRYARDRGREVVFVPFKWPELAAEISAGDFDVAVGGITVRRDRALIGSYTVPVAQSGAVVLTRRDGSDRDTNAFNEPSIRIAVNAGGHLQRVTEARFDRAQVLPINDNAAVPEALLAGSVDAVVTDTREAPHWLGLAENLRVLPPFTRDRKAFLVAGVPGLRADLDAWLMAREADGTLSRLRSEFLGDEADAPGTADPLTALLAAIDLRLGLMPAVAAAKAVSGDPIEVPEREAAVLDSAVVGIRRALEAGNNEVSDTLTPEAEAAVRSLFRAQIEAAKTVQRRTLEAGRADTDRTYDLDSILRPAIIGLGGQITRITVALPASLDADDVRRAVHRELASHDLPEAQSDAIAAAIVAVSEAL